MGQTFESSGIIGIKCVKNEQQNVLCKFKNTNVFVETLIKTIFNLQTGLYKI